jgi:ribonucleoside-diphosphate reductase alpha chain
MGERSIAPMGHVRMMAATQPFLSGAISKTINMPESATVEDVEYVYMQGWKLGLKAVALYRDGSKSSQPLNTSDKKKDKKDKDEPAELVSESGVLLPSDAAPIAARSTPSMPAPHVEEGARPPATVRHRLPKKRRGFTQEASVAGHKVFLRTGEYDDGSLGEIFIDMHKEGAAFRSLMNCFAISVSMGLQHGVPLNSYIDQFTFTRFEPSGPVMGHPNIKFATSMIDYIFRVLGVEYAKRFEFAQVPPEELQQEISNPTDVGAGQQAEQAVKGMLPPPPTLPDAQRGLFESIAPAQSLDSHLGEMMGDAPMCDQCGHITVRNGACYKCLNCGSSMGCS